MAPLSNLQGRCKWVSQNQDTRTPALNWMSGNQVSGIDKYDMLRSLEHTPSQIAESSFHAHAHVAFAPARHRNLSFSNRKHSDLHVSQNRLQYLGYL